VLLLIVLGIAAWVYLRSDRVNRFVIAKIEQGARDYGLRVKVGGFDFTWPTKTAKLRDLEVVNQQTGQLIATIKRAEISAGLPDLYALNLRRNVILQELLLSGVDLHIDIDAQGRSNFEGLRQPEKKSERVTVDSSQLVITLRDSRMQFNDQKHRFSTVLEALQAQLQAADQPGNFKTQLAAKGGSFGYEDRTATLDDLTAAVLLNIAFLRRRSNSKARSMPKAKSKAQPARTPSSRSRAMPICLICRLLRRGCAMCRRMV
jgi:uncharacterized protein YhdP